MAINTKNVLGTDSVSSSRITINDNVNTLKEALNDVLSIIDTSTGAINNSVYGSTNTIKTKGITVTTSGITIQAGDITSTLGDIVLDSGKIKLKNIELTQSIDGSSTIFSIGASGMGLPTASATGDFASISAPTLFFDTTDEKLKFFNGTTWETITSA